MVYDFLNMVTVFALTNSDIIGLIISIALVALTIAVCFYLLSKKDKKN
jgi:VIT1/CCC1 family predicted Fe2+/Mn2+ transporter